MPRLWLLLAAAIVVAGAGLRAWPAATADGPVWPPPPDVARIKYIGSIAEPRDIGAGPGLFGRVASALLGRKRQPHLLRPHAMATDSVGRLYVADTEQKMVHVLDVGRKKYSYLDPAPFTSPVGVAVGPDDSVWVTDSARRRVFRYSSDGKLRATLGVVKGEEIFRRPTGIAVADDGRIYVVDTLACRIEVLSPDGRVVATIGRRGADEAEFNAPTDIAIGRNGRLFVVDALNARLQVLDREGHYIRAVGHRGNGTGDMDKPKGVAVDSDGHLYVAEGLHDVLQIFSEDGRLLLVVGHSGMGAGEFSLPSAVHIDAANRVYVADALNSRVQVFQYVSQPDAR